MYFKASEASVALIVWVICCAVMLSVVCGNWFFSAYEREPVIWTAGKDFVLSPGLPAAVVSSEADGPSFAAASFDAAAAPAEADAGADVFVSAFVSALAATATPCVRLKPAAANSPSTRAGTRGAACATPA